MRYLNTAGPCKKKKHYMIEAALRLQGVEKLIDMEQYFVIHAARQSGKTTYDSFYYFCFDTETGKSNNSKYSRDEMNGTEGKKMIRPISNNTELYYYFHSNMKPEDIEEPNPTFYIGKLKTASSPFRSLSLSRCRPFSLKISKIYWMEKTVAMAHYPGLRQWDECLLLN